MKITIDGELREFHPNGMPKGLKGKITTCAVNPLHNKLILVARWKQKIYTDDTTNYHAEFDINKKQWDEIIKRELIEEEVEFDLLDEERLLVKITFPPIPYTEDEVRNLVFKTWDKLKPFHYNQAGSIELFDAWWDSIKKLK